jgi:hypothetical protein
VKRCVHRSGVVTIIGQDGLNASTVKMCNQTSLACARPGVTALPPEKLGRLGSRLAQYTVVWSTLRFDVANRLDLLSDQLELYRRGVTNAPRPQCCPPPFDEANNWMHEYPTAYVIPMGEGQSTAFPRRRRMHRPSGAGGYSRPRDDGRRTRSSPALTASADRRLFLARSAAIVAGLAAVGTTGYGMTSAFGAPVVCND